MKTPASATTRTTGPARSGLDPAQRVLARGEVITSPETRLRYRIEEFLGEGGFGQVYLARCLSNAPGVAETLCIKISARIDGWLREAYFGQLLDRHPRAIRIYDAFPLMRSGVLPLYCLALEYARHGDLRAFLRRGALKWPERKIRREIAGILEVLGKLHRGQLLHRDLTPVNVFVCEGPSLKLGDFGIVRQQSDRRGISARTMSALTAPMEILEGAVPKWQARDDVYQVGQLLGMLVKGDANVRIRTGEVRRLDCGDHLKEIVHRCIGERRKRYESADELIEALRNPPAPLRAGAVKSLRACTSRSRGGCRRRAAWRPARRAARAPTSTAPPPR